MPRIEVKNNVLDQEQEIFVCSKDQWHWIRNYCYILDPQQAPGILKWADWLHQHQLLDIIAQNDRVIILKARQIGVSWLLAAIALHTALFTPASNILIFSRGEREAVTMKERCHFMWSRLPAWMKQPIDKNNDQLLTFPVMNSKIQSFPARPGSGLGETATLVIFDEMAHMEYARDLYRGIIPTIEHGKFVGISTAYGRGNLFYETYMGAKNGENRFVPIFIPYYAKPGRTDETWEKEALADLPLYEAMQEYPRKEEEAFLIAGTCMFPVEILRNTPLIEPVHHGEGEVFIPPHLAPNDDNKEPGHTYAAALDTALGIAGRDYNVLQIGDLTTGEQVAKMRTQIPIEQAVEAAYELLTMYGQPYIIIEDQPQGRLAYNILTKLGYRKSRIYHRSRNVPNWHTLDANRRGILGALEIAIRTEAFVIHSEDTRDECLGFGYNDDKNRFEGLSGHDDEPMSLALMWRAKDEIKKLDFTPIDYLKPSRLKGSVMRKINWGKPDPFKDTVSAACHVCQGEKTIETRGGPIKCITCNGLGSLIYYA